MKKIYFLIASLLIINIGNAQIIFSDDFSSGIQPSNWTVMDVDGNTPDPNVATLFTDAWVGAPDPDNPSDTVAMSTSWYSPIGTSDDWLMSRQINLTSNNVLTWEEEAQDAGYPDGYEVYITTAIAGSTPVPADFTGANGSMILNVPAANGAAWLARTINLQNLGFGNQPVWLAWRNNSTNQFILMIDDITVTETPSFDVSISNPISPEYFLTPISQASPIGTAGLIINVGVASTTNATMEVNVYDGDLNNVYSATSAPVANIPSGGNATVSVPGYMPTSPDLYIVELIANIPDPDANPFNDTLRYIAVFTDSVYARDNGIVTGSLGIGVGGGQDAELGQSFVLTNPDTLTSVSAFIANGSGGMTGQPLSCKIYEVTNKTIGDLIATTDTITVDATMNMLWNLPVSGGPLFLADVDTFAVLVQEGDSNVTLGTASDIFTPQTTFVNWASNPVGRYAYNEEFGFNVSYILRANFGGERAACTPTTATLTETACDSYTAPSGAVFTASGTVLDTIVNSGGCDSIITINLTVNTVNTLVTTSGDTLTADLAGATSYQWIDCDNANTPIPGATGQSYVATASGNYAVIISSNDCRDTSDCVTVMTTSVGNKVGKAQYIDIFPNPSKGDFTLNFNGITTQELTLKIVDITGKVLLEKVVTNVADDLRLPLNLDLESGTYFVKISSKGYSETKQFVIY